MKIINKTFQVLVCSLSISGIYASPKEIMQRDVHRSAMSAYRNDHSKIDGIKVYYKSAKDNVKVYMRAVNDLKDQLDNEVINDAKFIDLLLKKYNAIIEAVRFNKLVNSEDEAGPSVVASENNDAVAEEGCTELEICGICRLHKDGNENTDLERRCANELCSMKWHGSCYREYLSKISSSRSSIDRSNERYICIACRQSLPSEDLPNEEIVLDLFNSQILISPESRLLVRDSRVYIILSRSEAFDRGFI